MNRTDHTMGCIREAELSDLSAIVAIEQRSHSMPWSQAALSSSLQNAVALQKKNAPEASSALNASTTALSETVGATVVPMHQFLVLQMTCLLYTSPSPRDRG